VKLKSAIAFFVVHLGASLASMPFFYSAFDKLYRSIGQAPAKISTGEAFGAILFQVLTIPLLVTRQVEHSVFALQDGVGTIWSAILRLSLNSLVYVLVAYVVIFCWKTISRRSHARA
jgi:hypothetical protein